MFADEFRMDSPHFLNIFKTEKKTSVGVVTIKVFRKVNFIMNDDFRVRLYDVKKSMKNHPRADIFVRIC